MTTINVLQLIGSIYVLIGLGFVLNSKFYGKVFDEFFDSKMSLLYGWIAAFVIWFIILLSFNNFWLSQEWLVAIIWVLSLIKWVFLILFPKTMMIFSKFFVNKKYIKLIWFTIMLFWALILYCAFKV